MLGAFPDYGKAPPNYAAAIAKVLADYPANIQERICDLRFGLASKLKFLPTVSDVVEMGDRLLKAEREAQEHAKRFAGRVPIQGTSEPFRPFPQLWAEFGNDFMDDQTRSKNVSFESLDAACKALVCHGREAALYALKNTVEKL
jgi:hypothetical protein